MIRAAIVGLGRWGQHLVACAEGSTRIRFTAAATRTPERAAAFAARHGLPVHAEYERVLADPDVDAVVLTTPHSQHASQIVAAARAGKHVFTEKPFTLNVRDAHAAIDACARAGVTLALGFNWRFQPALLDVRGMFADGRLGKLLHMEGNFNGPSVFRYAKEHWRPDRAESPAGGLTGRGVHNLDAMIFLAGAVESVYAQSFRQVLDYGVDDTTSLLLRFRSGATGYIGMVIASAECFRMQFFGTRGMVEIGDITHLHTWSMTLQFVDQPRQTVHYPALSTEKAELEAFADAIAAKRPHVIPPADILNGVGTIEAVLRSIESGVPEKVPG